MKISNEELVNRIKSIQLRLHKVEKELEVFYKWRRQDLIDIDKLKKKVFGEKLI